MRFQKNTTTLSITTETVTVFTNIQKLKCFLLIMRLRICLMGFSLHNQSLWKRGNHRIRCIESFVCGRGCTTSRVQLNRTLCLTRYFDYVNTIWVWVYIREASKPFQAAPRCSTTNDIKSYGWHFLSVSISNEIGIYKQPHRNHMLF